MTDHKPACGEELLPCPFCGSNAEDGHELEGRQDSTGVVYIFCTGCYAKTDKFMNNKTADEQARLAWNTRAPAPAREDVKAAYDALDAVLRNITNGAAAAIGRHHVENLYKHIPTIRTALQSQAVAGDDQNGHVSRNWTEDQTHENGNYTNKCCQCDKFFIGHKRRIICKRCAAPAATPDAKALEAVNKLQRVIGYLDTAGATGEIERYIQTIRQALSRSVPMGGEGKRFRIEHDGFQGTVIGHYIRLDGEEGVVMQQDGTTVVHVYRKKWLVPVEALRAEAKGR